MYITITYVYNIGAISPLHKIVCFSAKLPTNCAECVSFPALLQISCLCSYERLVTPTFCCTYL